MAPQLQLPKANGVLVGQESLSRFFLEEPLPGFIDRGEQPAIQFGSVYEDRFCECHDVVRGRPIHAYLYKGIIMRNTKANRHVVI